jgi:hypothetical protein
VSRFLRALLDIGIEVHDLSIPHPASRELSYSDQAQNLVAILHHRHALIGLPNVVPALLRFGTNRTYKTLALPPVACHNW